MTDKAGLGPGRPDETPEDEYPEPPTMPVEQRPAPAGVAGPRPEDFPLPPELPVEINETNGPDGRPVDLSEDPVDGAPGDGEKEDY